MSIEDFINRTIDVFGEGFFEDPYYRACLIEEVELFNNSYMDGHPISTLMDPEEQLNYVTRQFYSTAKMFLSTISPDCTFIFKGVDLSPYVADKEYYLNELEGIRITREEAQ